MITLSKSIFQLINLTPQVLILLLKVKVVEFQLLQLRVSFLLLLHMHGILFEFDMVFFDVKVKFKILFFKDVALPAD